MEDKTDNLQAFEDVDLLLKTIDEMFSLDSTDFTIDPEESKEKAPASAVDEYENRGFVDAQLREISLGIKEELLVDTFAKECYNWKQMYEIRMGMLSGVDVTLYENPYFTAEQMHEIRIGLIDEVDVKRYASLSMSVTDMRSMRFDLCKEKYLRHPNSFAKEIKDDDTKIKIRITDDCMEAYVTVDSGADFAYIKSEIKRALKRNEITYGINKTNIEKLVDHAITGKEVLIAAGEPAFMGTPGKYEIFFKNNLADLPKEDENGHVDYSAVKAPETVNPGMVLAKYHPATQGKSGMTVTGIFIEGLSGKDLLPLSGAGIKRNAEDNTYIATQRGFAYYNEASGILNVRNIYNIDGDATQYNGKINYDGQVIVGGDVRDNAEIIATGDIVVKGFVESAVLKSSQNIIIHGGANCAGKGSITAGGRVIGDFFEEVTINAKGVVEGNYFLNCDIETDGKVIARGGKSRIMGGKIVAALGVEANRIGNYGNGSTIIDVGNLWRLEHKIDEITEQIATIDNDLKQLEDGKQKLYALFGSDEAETSPIFKRTVLTCTLKDKEKLNLLKEVERLKAVKEHAIYASIYAKGILYADVLVMVNGKAKKILEDTKCISLNNQNIKGDS